jgi:hypothetical protein
MGGLSTGLTGRQTYRAGVPSMELSPFGSRFVASDYPACEFYLDVNSVVLDGGLYLLDQANGLLLKNTTDNYTEMVSLDSFRAVSPGGSNPYWEPVSGSLPVIGDKNVLTWVIGENMPGSDTYVEYGDITTGSSLYVSVRATNDYVGSSTSNMVATADKTGAVGTILGGAMTWNRQASSDLESINGYRVNDLGERLHVSGNTDVGSANSTTIPAFAYQGVTFNVTPEHWSIGLMLFDDPQLLCENLILDGLEWMVGNPGYLYPGWKHFT